MRLDVIDFKCRGAKHPFYQKSTTRSILLKERPPTLLAEETDRQSHPNTYYDTCDRVCVCTTDLPIYFVETLPSSEQGTTLPLQRNKNVRIKLHIHTLRYDGGLVGGPGEYDWFPSRVRTKKRNGNDRTRHERCKGREKQRTLHVWAKGGRDSSSNHVLHFPIHARKVGIRSQNVDERRPRAKRVTQSSENRHITTSKAGGSTATISPLPPTSINNLSAMYVPVLSTAKKPLSPR